MIACVHNIKQRLAFVCIFLSSFLFSLFVIMINHVIPDKSTSLSMPRGHYGNRKAIVGVCCRFAFMCCRQTSPGLQGIWAGVIAQVSSHTCRTRPLDVSDVVTDILLRSTSEELEVLHHPSTITADFHGIPSFPGETLHVALSW